MKNSYRHRVYWVTLLSLLELASISNLAPQPWTSCAFPHEENLHGATYGNGQFVAVGEAGTIGVSPNGSSWDAVALGASVNLVGVTYGQGLYVAVGPEGQIWTSTDGTEWTPQASGTDAWLSAVAYGNGTFVVVGENGTIRRSNDGQTWLGARPTQAWLQDVHYAAGQFVAVGGKSLLTSPNGLDWQTAENVCDLVAVTYGEGVWLAVGGRPEPRKFCGAGYGVAYRSWDAVHWEKAQTTNLPWFRDVTYAGGEFVAVAGTDYGEVLGSTDGLAWEIKPLEPVYGLNAVASDGQQLVAAGVQGTLLCRPAREFDPRTVAAGPIVISGTPLVFNDNGTRDRQYRIQASSDGINWDFLGLAQGTGLPLEFSGYDPTLWDGAYARALWIGDPEASPLDDWGQTLQHPSHLHWTKLAYGNGQWVALANRFTLGWHGATESCESAILASYDGQQWDRVYWDVLPSGLNGLAFGQGQFVAAGDQGLILHSLDGQTWTTRWLETDEILTDLAFGADRFVALTDSGRVWVSTDASSWTPYPIRPDHWWQSLHYGNGQFVAVNSSTEVATSTDGESWTLLTSTTPVTWLTWADGSWVNAQEYSSTVYRSVDLVTWTLAGQLPQLDDPWGPLSGQRGIFWSPSMICYAADQFLLSGFNWEEDRYVNYLSPNLDAWGDPAPWIDSGMLHDLAFADGQYVAIGDFGSVATSLDGTNWQQHSPAPLDRSLTQIAVGNGTTVMLAYPASLITSWTESSDWIEHTFEDIDLVDLVWSGSEFVALDSTGQLLVSTDGLDWQRGTTGATWQHLGLAYGNGYFLAVGWEGDLIQTADPLDEWSTYSFVNSPLRSVTFVDDSFVLGTSDGWLGISPTGSEWTWALVANESPIRAVASGNDQFVALAENGELYTSAGGMAWTLLRSDSFVGLQDVAFIDGLFLAVGEGGNVCSSIDGVSWRLHPSHIGSRLSDISLSEEGVWIVGAQGRILSPIAISPTAPWVRVFQPDIQALDGEILTLSVAIGGAPPLTYQWYKDNDPLPGANSRRLTLGPLSPADAGEYTLDVSNHLGQVRSDAIHLAVLFPPQIQFTLSPTANRLMAPAEVNLNAAVHDPDGQVVQVDFLVGDTTVLVDRFEPFECTYRADQPGVYQLSAQATDDSGLTSFSETHVIQVLSENPFLNWIVSPDILPCIPTVITCLNDRYYLGGDRGQLCHAGSDLKWESVQLETGNNIQDFGFGDGHYVALDDRGGIWTSLDGHTWEHVTETRLFDGRLVYGDGQFVAVGGIDTRQGLFAGVAWARSDGLDSWQRWYALDRPPLTDIAFGQGRFVAVGQAGGTTHSLPDGTWVPWTEAPPALSFSAIDYGKGQFLSTLSGPWMLPDEQDPGQTNHWFESWVVASPNGSDWTAVDTDSSGADFVDLIYAAGHFVGLSALGGTSVSRDGCNWDNCLAASGFYGSRITYGMGRFLAVGSNRTLLRSEPVPFLDGDGPPLTYSFFAETGMAYRIETSDNLINWIPGEVFVGEDKRHPVSLGPAGSQHRYYRVLWLP